MFCMNINGHINACFIITVYKKSHSVIRKRYTSISFRRLQSRIWNKGVYSKLPCKRIPFPFVYEIESVKQLVHIGLSCLFSSSFFFFFPLQNVAFIFLFCLVDCFYQTTVPKSKKPKSYLLCTAGFSGGPAICDIC